MSPRRPAQPYLSQRALDALHRPIRTLPQVYLVSYSVVDGAIATRLFVVRYRHLWGGAPLWHATVMIRTPDGPPKDRVEWTRQEQTAAERVADRLIAPLGAGETMRGTEAEMSNVATEHRLRRLDSHERAHLPKGMTVPVLDLYGEEPRDV